MTRKREDVRLVPDVCQAGVQRHKRRVGRPNKYDWPSLLKAGVRVFKAGKDYSCTRRSFVTSVYKAASLHGVKAWVSVNGSDVEFEFYERTRPSHAIDRRQR